MAKTKKCTEDHRCPACGRKVDCSDNNAIILAQDTIRQITPEMRRSPVEEMWMFWYDEERNPIGRDMIGRGGNRNTIFSLQEVARRACLASATYAVAVHNHPACDAAGFSRQDETAGDGICRHLNSVGVTLVDEIVICPNGRWASMLSKIRSAKKKTNRRR